MNYLISKMWLLGALGILLFCSPIFVGLGVFCARFPPRSTGGLIKFMNYRLRIERLRYIVYGTVVKYLPGVKNDGIELWKVRHDDGDEEDVELHELIQYGRVSDQWDGLPGGCTDAWEDGKEGDGCMHD